MSPTLSQIFSVTLHAALLIYVVNSHLEIKPLDDGQDLIVEFQNGDIPLGSSPTPTKKVKAQPVPLQKIAKKKVKKTVDLPPKKIVELPVKKKEVKAPIKQEDEINPMITQLPEKAPSPKKVITQEEESFAKVVIPEETKPVEETTAPKKEKKVIAAATTSNLESSPSEEISKSIIQATTLPEKMVKAQTSEEPLVPIETAKAQDPKRTLPPTKTAKDSQVVAASSQNNVDAFGAPKGIRDARKLQQRPGNRRPEYPVPDRLNRRQGKVVLLAFVTEQGKVEKIRVESAKATHLMTNEAVGAFSRYRFSKGQQGWVRMPIEFRLVGATKNMAARLRQTKSQ